MHMRTMSGLLCKRSTFFFFFSLERREKKQLSKLRVLHGASFIKKKKKESRKLNLDHLLIFQAKN